MHSNIESGSGGAPVRPSARPSIHRGKCHLACCTVMGRYGLPKNTGATAPLSSLPRDNSEGYDVVDANALSKHCRASSPIPARRTGPRRKSVELPNSLHTDDSSDSEEFGDFNINEHHNASNASNRSGLSHASTNTSSNEIYELNNYNDSPARYKQRYTQSGPQNTKKLSTTITSISLIGVIGAAIACYYGDFLGDGKGTYNLNKYDEIKFMNDLNDLGMKYRIGDDSILQVQTGISTIFEKQDTGSFIFTYNSNTNYYDPIEFNKFIETLASTTSKYLRNESTSVRHIVIDSSKLEMRSPIELVNKYREDIANTGLMLVKEVDQVPSTLAMAFHYYCDEYNPIAKKSAVFFTLDMARCSPSPVNQKPTHAAIEKCLANKWKSVSKDSIGPLLTRVVNVVVDVSK